VPSDACEICRRISSFSDDNPYFVSELSTGYALLADSQYYPGYSLFVSRLCVPELHELPAGVRTPFLQEMALVAEAVCRAFQPRKLNYEMLGNSVAHLHWHLIPRSADDPNPRFPAWSNPAFLDAPRLTPVEPAVLRDRRDRLRRALVELRGEA